MTQAQSAAAPLHYTAPEFTEPRVRAGIQLALFAYAFAMLIALANNIVWVVFTDELIEVAIPLNIGRAILNLVLDVVFIIGVFKLTTWPGPASAHKTWVRVCAFAGPLGIVVGGIATALLGTLWGPEGFARFSTYTSRLFGLLGGVGVWSALFFCAAICTDRGRDYGATFRLLVGGLIALALVNSGVSLVFFELEVMGLIGTLLSFAAMIVAFVVSAIVFMGTIRALT